MDDLFLKIFKDPQALGAVAIILFINLVTIYLVTRFASRTTDNVTKIVGEDDSKEVVKQLVELLGSQLEVSKETKKVVENNTAAFGQFVSSNTELKGAVDRMDESIRNLDIKNIVTNALRPIEKLVNDMICMEEKNEVCLKELSKQLEEVINNIHDNIAKAEEQHGTSNNTNINPVGQGCTDIGDRTTTL